MVLYFFPRIFGDGNPGNSVSVLLDTAAHVYGLYGLQVPKLKALKPGVKFFICQMQFISVLSLAG